MTVEVVQQPLTGTVERDQLIEGLDRQISKLFARVEDLLRDRADEPRRLALRMRIAWIFLGVTILQNTEQERG